MVRHLSPRTLELRIDSINTRGYGVGIAHDENEIPHKVEIPSTVPGDYVRVNIRRKRHQRWCGSLVEVIEPGPSRVEPRCRHFGICGGCSLQQMSYEAQLHYKEAYIRQCFHSFIEGGVYCHPILHSHEEWKYRNKMEYTFSSDAAGHQFLGLIMQGTKRHVLNLTECHLVSPWFTEALETTRQWWQTTPLQAYRPTKDEGTFRTLVLREGKSSGDRLVMLTVSGNPEYAPARAYLNTLVAALRAAIEPKNGDAKLSIFLRIQQAHTGMTTNFYEMLLYGPDHIREDLTVDADSKGSSYQFRFLFSPTAFFQPNPRQSALLYSRAMQLAEIQKDDTVYDLFCGIGTISICASRRAKEVVGIDISPETALDARRNAQYNNAENVTIYAGAVRHVIMKIKEEKRHLSPDIIFIDPPRSGLDPISIDHILELGARKIIYISCNPKTQAADVEKLTNKGYRLVSLQPIDQFPQVAHVENIALLVRVDGSS